MKVLPKAKTDNTVVQNLGDEMLVYDLTANQAYNLNATAAKIFNACDGKTSFDELKSKHNFSDDLIFLALNSLNEKGLLEPDYVSPFAGVSRRQVIRRIGFASMVALPIISAIVAPSAAQAASTVACATGTGPGPLGSGGSGAGQRCSCPPGTVAGTQCSYGTGSGGAPNTYCRTGCTCTSTSTSAACTSGQTPCLGVCS